MPLQCCRMPMPANNPVCKTECLLTYIIDLYYIPANTSKPKVGAAVDPLHCSCQAIHNSVGIWAECGIAIQERPTAPLKDVRVPRQQGSSQLATNLCGIALGAGLGILARERHMYTSDELNVKPDYMKRIWLYNEYSSNLCLP